MEKRTIKEMTDEFVKFCEKHGGVAYCNTSEMKNNCYHKTFIMEDGKEWWECNDTIKVEIEQETLWGKLKAIVEVFRTEYWTSDFGSRYVYMQIKGEK